MRQPRVSVVTATYNRRDRVERSIDSALGFVRAYENAELVVVDDASPDLTASFLRKRYDGELRSGIMRLVALADNQGVCGAKNAGVEAASGEWIAYLNDDDMFLPGADCAFITAFARAGTAPFLFFRAQSAAGRLFGKPEAAPADVGLQALVDHRFGECMPVVRRTSMLAEPFPAELRCFEGLAYARMIVRFGPGRLEPFVTEVYDDTGSDRMSRLLGRNVRGLAGGHYEIGKLYLRHLGPLSAAPSLAKAAAYSMLALVRR